MRLSAPILAGAVLLTVLGSGPTHAATTRPVLVQGTALRERLASLYLTVDPQRDQFDGGLFTYRRLFVGLSGLPIQQPFATFFELMQVPPDVEVGIYNGHLDQPELIPVFLAGSPPMSYASVVLDPFRQLVRVIRYAPDFSIAEIVRTVTPVDTSGVGLYIRGPRGTFFSQDSRQPDGSPHALWFDDLSGSYRILAWEDSPAASADDDFDDVIVGWQDGSEGPYTVGSRRMTWSRLKRDFR